MKRIIGLIIFLALLTTPYMGSAAEQQKLPTGFIAVSDDGMTWAEADAFCRQKGGKLPLIGGMKQWDGEMPSLRGRPIDGFGYGNRPWNEVGLRAALYWTGTEHSKVKGVSWVVYEGSDGVSVQRDSQSRPRYAVCVP